MTVDEGRIALRRRARIASVALIVFMVLDCVLEILLIAAFNGSESGQDLLAGGLIVRMIGLVGSVISVSIWIYRANANLREQGTEGMEFTPGWAVGWYFVPVGNLFKPFQAMREIWNVSFADDEYFSSESHPLLIRWWACWIAGNMLTNLNERAFAEQSLYVPVSFVCLLLSIGAGMFMIQIIHRVTTRQVDSGVMAEVFA